MNSQDAPGPIVGSGSIGTAWAIVFSRAGHEVWAVVGPFETSDLNVRGGTAAHAAPMGAAYARMGAERGQHDPWTESLIDEVAGQRRAVPPLDRWDDHVAWRDTELMALARYRAQRARSSAATTGGRKRPPVARSNE